MTAVCQNACLFIAEIRCGCLHCVHLLQVFAVVVCHDLLLNLLWLLVTFVFEISKDASVFLSLELKIKFDVLRLREFCLEVIC